MNISDESLIDIYRSTETIAVVGASGDESKPAFRIPRYLQAQGFKIIPVNPKGGEILGQRVATSLEDVGEAIDVVDVFRPAEEAPDIARAAVAARAKVLWLQKDIVSEEAAEIATAAGLKVVMGICMGETHRRLGLGS